MKKLIPMTPSVKSSWSNLPPSDYFRKTRIDYYSSNTLLHDFIQRLRDSRKQEVFIVKVSFIVIVICIISMILFDFVDSQNKIQAKNQKIAELKENLQQQQWKNADSLTRRLFRENQEDFSCDDLSVINKLWIENSDGRFGLTVQKYLWESSLSKVKRNKGLLDFQNDDEKSLLTFGDVVGWRKTSENRWLRYDEYLFSGSPEKFPTGYFPISWGDVDVKFWDLQGLSNILNKCNIR